MLVQTLLCVLTASPPLHTLSDEGGKVAAKAEIGKPAPDFTLKDQNGKEVKLSSLRGKQSVLITFYFRDFAGGCTAELKSFRDEHDVFVKAGVKIFGISVDGIDSHKRFCEELKLPFSLLSDEEGKVSKLYGAQTTSAADETLPVRSVFLVDKEGILSLADATYDLKTPDDHSALLKAVAALKSKTTFSQPKVTAIIFGRITVDGKERTSDLIFDRGTIRERDKSPSKELKGKYGHTPLSASEDIPWDCKTLLIGTGMDGQLPVLDEVKQEAKKREVKLILLKSPDAVEYLKAHDGEEMNAILHITC